MGLSASPLKRWFVKGVVITIPLVVTLLVVVIAFDLLLGLLSPVVAGVAIVWTNEPRDEIVAGLTVASLPGLFVLVGLVAEYTPGERLSRNVHRTMGTIPGVGAVYTSIRRASNIVVDDDTRQFQDVKLVEFPHRDAYALGFLTADTPTQIDDAAGIDELCTIMIPLGPNPMTNGFIINVPAERLRDVDLTVEEAVGTIATLGVASDRLDDGGR